MTNSRLIRTVLSICLIVTIGIEPIALGAARAECGIAGLKRAVAASANGSQENAADPSCGGCGHCEVASSESLCGCCGGAESEATPPSCGDEEHRQPAGKGGASGERFGAVSNRSQAGSDAKVVQSHSSAVVSGVCLCTVQSQPAAPTTPAAPLRAEGDAAPWMVTSCVPPVRPLTVGSKLHLSMADWEYPHPLDRHSKLCVWRL